MPVTRKIFRRTFTKLSLLSGGALVLPVASAAASAVVSNVTLTAEEQALITRFAEALLPTEGTALKPRSEVPILDNVARAFSMIDEPTLEEIRLGLKLFDYGAIVIGLHFERFVHLPPQQRIAYIHRWEDGIAMQRGIVDLLKKLVYIGYWQDIGAGRAIGYVGPVSVAGGVPSLGNAPMPTSG